MKKKNKTEKCPLYEFCEKSHHASNMCLFTLPDESCYWFQWFRKRMKEVKRERIQEKRLYEDY